MDKKTEERATRPEEEIIDSRKLHEEMNRDLARNGKSGISAMSALALAVGIALQNFPEGAIVSMPLNACGISKPKSFLYGALSGIVEPLGAVAAIFAAGFFVPIMPYFLSFAAGAMFYVVIEELLPQNEKMSVGTLFFALGFIVMMALDVGMG